MPLFFSGFFSFSLSFNKNICQVSQSFVAFVSGGKPLLGIESCVLLFVKNIGYSSFNFRIHRECKRPVFYLELFLSHFSTFVMLLIDVTLPFVHIEFDFFFCVFHYFFIEFAQERNLITWNLFSETVVVLRLWSLKFVEDEHRAKLMATGLCLLTLMLAFSFRIKVRGSLRSLSILFTEVFSF